ncbi:hypothetical protein [Sphingobacterium sp. LRF_L2]|uniref:hypothetical protein n=1 Tax=Sphingobacterium sp. LRF_L2 TaxID=3369421 RepID=UPI003F602A66
MTAFITALFFSCQQQEDKSTVKKTTYIDIPQFFQQEIKRLATENPEIEKTVVKDSSSETKKMAIQDWSNELASFSTVDLNKPAYNGLIKKDSTDKRVIYTTNDPKIDLTSVEIQYDEQNTASVFLIKRRIKNLLYQTNEVLIYKKNQSYSIEKNQSVILLGDKHYQIQANF